MFSVVIPSYNSGKTIARTISSILSQTYQEFELIIVDNSSTDNTKDIVDSFKDKRISFHIINNNGMPAVSRNFGVSLANYEFIAFCDSDDTWTNNKLSESVHHINRGEQFISHDLHLKGSLFKPFLKKIFFRPKPTNFNELILQGNPIFQSSVIIKKELILNAGCYSIDKRYIAIEDFHLWANVLQLGAKLKFVNKKLGYYFYSSSALTSSANQFMSNRAFRLDFSPSYKPAWYKYNIATYLLRKNMNRRSILYLRSICFQKNCSFELRLKSFFLLLKACIR